jgi:hypothetical protein
MSRLRLGGAEAVEEVSLQMAAAHDGLESCPTKPCRRAQHKPDGPSDGNIPETAG